MATTKIEIRDGRIVDYRDQYFEAISEDGLRYRGNGWTVKIVPANKRSSGKIICHCQRQYSDGIHKYHREFALVDGLLGLAGGHIDERYAYFRKAEFQAFLNKFGIDRVERGDPNQVFRGHEQFTCECHQEHIDVISDGVVSFAVTHVYSEGWEKVTNRYQVDQYLYSKDVEYSVSGATWAVVREYTANMYTPGGPYGWHAKLVTNVKDVTGLVSSLKGALMEKGLETFWS